MNDNFSQKKIIDVLTFDNAGIPKFGADIFNIPKKYPKRIIFEYSTTCKMSLRFSEKKDSILFDHLSPNEPQFVGVYQYYCSDGTYDGFGFKHGKWNYKTFVNAFNDKEENDRFYGDPHNTGPEKEPGAKLNPRDKSYDKNKKGKNLEKEKNKK